jgi:5-methylcytosine-specific restriction endonuclease McrA
MSAVPSTRAEAFAVGADRYFTGQPCRHGHVTERYVSGSCVGCREANYQRRAPEVRARLQASRDADREGVKQRRNEWYARTKAARGPVRNALMRRRFFYGRSVNLRGPGKATARDLAAIWKRQRGVCELTGRRLDRSAEIDHILPKVRGGSDAPGNLRWVVKDANRAKRDLLDADFLQLCRDVVRRAGA